MEDIIFDDSGVKMGNENPQAIIPKKSNRGRKSKAWHEEQARIRGENPNTTQTPKNTTQNPPLNKAQINGGLDLSEYTTHEPTLINQASATPQPLPDNRPMISGKMMLGFINLVFPAMGKIVVRVLTGKKIDTRKIKMTKSELEDYTELAEQASKELMVQMTALQALALMMGIHYAERIWEEMEK